MIYWLFALWCLVDVVLWGVLTARLHLRLKEAQDYISELENVPAKRARAHVQAVAAVVHPIGKGKEQVADVNGTRSGKGEGAVEDIEAFFRVGLMIAASADYPQWNEKSEFREVREASLKASR